MLKVLFTIDTELQFQSGTHRDQDAKANYAANVLGQSRDGAFGLSYQLEIFRKLNIRSVFFVEALHAHVVGGAFLEKTVRVIREARQDIELHLHVEWLRRLREPLFGKPAAMFTRDYSLDEQCKLIDMGLSLLRKAGAEPVRAFRAGAFGANDLTIQAVGRNGLQYDSSYNAVYDGGVCRIEHGRARALPMQVGPVIEVPVTVFRTPPFGMRPAAVGACSFVEMRKMLDIAYEADMPLFVILSHSFEMLTADRRHVNPIVVQRFEKLCRYLDSNRDRFQTVGFHNIDTRDLQRNADESLLVSNPLTTISRAVQQAAGRLYELR